VVSKEIGIENLQSHLCKTFISLGIS